MQHKNSEMFPILERVIRDYIDCYGNPPTVAEIAKAAGMPKSTTSRYLSHMRENGMLQYDTGRHGVMPEDVKSYLTDSRRMPVLGAVSCGVPRLAEENIEEYVRLPASLVGAGEFFLLRANGQSMIEAGINDGDLVLVRQQDYAEAGQIVVALMEEEATLKRFYPEPEHHRVRLHPENSSMEDIIVDDCIIQGVAVKVLKDLV